jgi:tetratricopeptide (TPR) repeat protein
VTEDKENPENTTDDAPAEKPAKSVNAPAKKKTAKIENPSLPKDRNARVREQAARKLAEAQGGGSGGRRAAAAGGLSTEEMVDDALARALAASTRWAKANLRYIEIGAAGLVIIGIGFAVYDWQYNRKLEKASDALYRAVVDATGRVVEKGESKPDDPEEAYDTRPKFPSEEARQQAVLADYKTASVEYVGTGAAILARLGEAGALLDKKDFDGAIAAYREVLSTQLGKADLDVQLASYEGLGMALEGKGDVDGAIEQYKKLEGSKERGFQELGMYHQARLLLTKKGERDLAKGLLLKAKEQLTVPPGEPTAAAPVTHDYVMGQINGLLRDIDPSLAPAPTTAPGGGGFDQMSIEQLMEQKRMIDRLRARAAQQQQQKAPAPPITGSPEPLPAPSQ